jgi:hypothetical protein
MNCNICMKNLLNFDIEYVDEYGSPKYHTAEDIDRKIFCGPECSLQYYQQQKDTKCV